MAYGCDPFQRPFPVDLSHTCEATAKYVRELSGATGATVTLPESGRLREVRFYGDNGRQQPLAVIGIADDGALLPMTWLT